MNKFLILFLLSPIVYGECLSPLPENNDYQLLCRTGYMTLYDKVHKIPKLAVETLDTNKVLGCNKRSNKFIEDSDIKPKFQSKVVDYYHSGFDKGHLVPAGDMLWNKKAQDESFYMSNIAPQHPNFNRGTWKTLELYIREAVIEQNHIMTIYTGSIYSGESKKLSSGVTIPDEFYKVIVDETSKERITFLIPNIPDVNPDITKYIIPYQNLRIDLNLPELKDVFKIYHIAGYQVDDIKRVQCSK